MNTSILIALTMTSISIGIFAIVIYLKMNGKIEKKWVEFLMIQQALACVLYFGFNLFAHQAVFKSGYDFCLVTSWLFVLILKILNIDTRSRSGQIFLLLSFIISFIGLSMVALSKGNVVYSQNNLYEMAWFFHMSANCVVVVFLTASLILGFNYLYNQRKIKQHDLKNDLDQSVLSLTKIDQLMSKMLYITVVGVHISLIAGVVLAHKTWGREWLHNPKFIVSVFMLILFSMLIWGRHRWGWRGRKFVKGLVICELTLIVLLLLSFWP